MTLRRGAELSESPFILFGAPRSGTTYLQTLIGADPRVVMTNETRVFTWLHRVLHDVTADDKAVARRKGEFLTHLRAELPDLIRRFYARLDPEATYWGDKNPFYGTEAGVLDTIESLYPRTRYVHLIRDGRDVITSLCQRHKPDGTPWATFESGHEVWLRSLDVGRSFGRGVGDRYLELRYEDLIADDEALLCRVVEHLGLEPSREALALARSQRSNRTPLSEPTRDLDAADASSWRTAWSAAERVRSLDLLGRALIDLGYESEASLAKLRRRTSH